MKVLEFQSFLKNINKEIKPNKTPYIIGVAGGSGSGKSFISSMIQKQFNCVVLKIDDYYKRKTRINNKDIPQALNLDLVKQHLIKIHMGQEIIKPVYTFALDKDYFETLQPEKIIILDGLFALNEKFINQLDLKIFLDASEEIRFERRLKRDMEERGCCKEAIIKRWQETVEPMYQKYVLPQKNKADLIIKNS